MTYLGQTVRVPLGQRGFNPSKNHARMGPADLVFVDNASLQDDLLQKIPGAAKVNSSALSDPIVSGISWIPETDRRDVVLVGDVTGDANGVVLKDTGGGGFSTTMSSSIGYSGIAPIFVAAGGEDVGADRKLFLFANNNQVQFVAADGNTMADIPFPPSDWTASVGPIFGVQHDLRMWAGGNSSDPHRIYYSTLTDHGNFTAAGSGTLPIYPGEGETLIGGVSFNGLLVLFKKPVGIYVVDARDANSSNWKVTRLSQSVGCASPHAIVPIENDVLYMDRSGRVHSLTATNEFGDIQTSSLDISFSRVLKKFAEDPTSPRFMDFIQGIWVPERREAWFIAAPIPAAIFDTHRMLVIDLNDEEANKPRFLVSGRDGKATSLWMRFDIDDTLLVTKPAQGDIDGFVWSVDEDARNKDGVAYEMKVETPSMDLSAFDATLATRRKNGEFLEVVAKPSDGAILTVEVYWDGTLAQTLTFDLPGTGDEPISVRKRIVGSGRRIKLIAKNSELDKNPQLMELLLSFTLGDQRTTE